MTLQHDLIIDNDLPVENWNIQNSNEPSARSFATENIFKDLVCSVFVFGKLRAQVR